MARWRNFKQQVPGFAKKQTLNWRRPEVLTTQFDYIYCFFGFGKSLFLICARKMTP
jgi:hypothetical protein